MVYSNKLLGRGSLWWLCNHTTLRFDFLHPPVTWHLFPVAIWVQHRVFTAAQWASRTLWCKGSGTPIAQACAKICAKYLWSIQTDIEYNDCSGPGHAGVTSTFFLLKPRSAKQLKSLPMVRRIPAMHDILQTSEVSKAMPQPMPFPKPMRIASSGASCRSLLSLVEPRLSLDFPFMER